MGNKNVVLETDVYNGELGHAAKHNAVNDQVNWLTTQLKEPGSNPELTASYARIGVDNLTLIPQRDGDDYIERPNTDQHVALRHIMNNSSAGFVDHLISGPNMSTPTGPGGLIGLGIGHNGVVGIVMDVSAPGDDEDNPASGGQAICFSDVGPFGRAFVVSTLGEGKALHIFQGSDSGVTAGNALTITQNNADPEDDQLILAIENLAMAGGPVGATNVTARASDGLWEFTVPIKVNGGQIKVSAYDILNPDEYSHVALKDSAVRWRGATGADSFWTHEAVADFNEWKFRTYSPAAEGAETSPTTLIRASGSGIGFFGAAPVWQQTLPSAATDAATTQALANAIRTAFLNLGLAP